MSDTTIAAEKRARELIEKLPTVKAEELLVIAFLDGAVHGFDMAIATGERVRALHKARHP